MLLMLPTATDSLPDGHERGEYFALDFGGGPTLRLLFVRFSEDRRHETSVLDLEEVEVPARLRTAHADELFDFLAEKALDFVRRVGWDAAAKGPPVFGFCFSFPISQDLALGGQGGAARGTLVRWAKGYSCEGGVGCEPSACLEAAARRVSAARRASDDGGGDGGGAASTPGVGVGVGVGVGPSPPPLVDAALANDTVATLAAARYEDGGDAAMSLVLHRGTNAAYVECVFFRSHFVFHFFSFEKDLKKMTTLSLSPLPFFEKKKKSKTKPGLSPTSRSSATPRPSGPAAGPLAPRKSSSTSSGLPSTTPCFPRCRTTTSAAAERRPATALTAMMTKPPLASSRP